MGAISARELSARVLERVKMELAEDRLGKILRTETFGAATRHIKAVFGKLGQDLCYKVCASGCLGATEGEWLYDLIWYTEFSDGLLDTVALVLETELNPGSGAGPTKAEQVDGDFQKLIQARTQIRVWLVALPNPQVTRIHLENCKRQAKMFSGAQSGDTYLFITYDWTIDKTEFELFEV